MDVVYLQWSGRAPELLPHTPHPHPLPSLTVGWRREKSNSEKTWGLRQRQFNRYSTSPRCRQSRWRDSFGRQVFSHLQESRPTSGLMVTWKTSTITLNVVPSSFVPSGFITEHAAVCSRISLLLVGVIYVPSVSPPTFLPIPRSMRSSGSLDGV